MANPEKVASAFAVAAKRLDANINENCAALGVEQQGGKVYGVVTEHGLIKTPQALVAAGAWSSRILEPLGIRHPSLWVRASVAKTQPIKLNLRKLVVWGSCILRVRGQDRSISCPTNFPLSTQTPPSLDSPSPQVSADTTSG